MATFHQISSQNLECPICLTLFDQPKSLTCSHTFCKDCLECVFQIQPDQHIVTCPVCRKQTLIPSGDVDKLPTNIPLSSLVDEVKTKSPKCSVCETEEKPPPESYCQDCGVNMCTSCKNDHSKWKIFSNHAVVAIKEVVSGKVTLTRRQKCKKHPNEYAEYFCPGCREYVCFRCEMLEQSQKGHDMVEASIHEEEVLDNINDLKEKAKLKKATVEKHIESIDLQRKITTDLMRKLSDDIDKTYDECMQILSERKKTLKCQVERWSEKFEKDLEVMAEESRQTLTHIKTVEELIANGMKVPLERDAILAHDTLCENLESLLGRDDPDDQSPRDVTEQAQKILFRKQVKVNELCLGEFEDYPWDLKANIKLPGKGCVECMTTVPDGRMAMGTSQGGILLYSSSGELQEMVLKDVKCESIGFLSDGRCVVFERFERERREKQMSLYTSQWEKINVEFPTMDDSFHGLTVGSGDNIYLGCSRHETIHVFTPQGGKAIREIMCHTCTCLPYQLFSFRTNENLILTDKRRFNVVCLDSRRNKENVLEKEGMLAFPAVCRDDSVIVAWVSREGLLSIDRYTGELEHVRNLITDFDLGTQAPASAPLYFSFSLFYGWCFLSEFQSGEIAFRIRDRLYIFS
ncbi:uncharacterized protein [Diadema antillarum]|uniref:uncharacterized protein n=1 Tax=Diadema antillarum TaxID=105358 RepID=UPI003A89A1DF